MNYKENLEAKNFYTFCIGEWIKKSEKSKLFLFYNFIEKTLNEFPKIKEKEFEVIRFLLLNLYKIIAIPEKFEEYLKYVVFLERRAEDLEEKCKDLINHFVDFSVIEKQEIKDLNNLRINLRILESLFWEAAYELKDDGRYLVIPHFLNVASKFVFYYIVYKFRDDLKELTEKIEEIEYNKELYEKYKEIYTKKSLKEYL